MGLPGGRGIDTGADPFVRSLDSDAQDRRIIVHDSQLLLSPIIDGLYPQSDPSDTFPVVNHPVTSNISGEYIFVPLQTLKADFRPTKVKCYIYTTTGGDATSYTNLVVSIMTLKNDIFTEVPGTRGAFVRKHTDGAGMYTVDIPTGTKLLAGKQYFYCTYLAWAGAGAPRLGMFAYLSSHLTQTMVMWITPDTAVTELGKYAPSIAASRLPKFNLNLNVYIPYCTYYSALGEKLLGPDPY